MLKPGLPVQARGGKIFAGSAQQGAGFRKTATLSQALTGKAMTAG